MFFPFSKNLEGGGNVSVWSLFLLNVKNVSGVIGEKP